MPARRTQSNSEKKKIEEAKRKFKNIQMTMEDLEKKIADINEKMADIIKKNVATDHKTLDAQDLDYFKNLYIDKQVYEHLHKLMQEELSEQFFRGGGLK